MPYAIRRSSAFLPLLLLALAAFSPPALPHADKPHAPPAAASAANTVDFVGRVGSLIVVDHTTGVTRGYPYLELADGQRFRLENAGEPPVGSWIGVSGRRDHHTLHATSVRALAAPPAPRQALTRVQLMGTLQVFHVDYPDGTAEFGYSLFGDNGRRNVIDFGTPPPGVENFARVAVSGPVDASGFVNVDTIEILGSPLTAPKPKATAALGTMNYTVFPLKYPNNTAAPFTYNADPASWPISTITSTIFGASPAQSVAEYFKEVSFGAQLVGGVVANATNTWLKANAARPTACGSTAELNAVLDSIETNGMAAASAAGYNPNANPGQHYVLDALPCGWAGLGYIGFPLAYSKGTASLLVVGHEWGHNFGLWHAGSVDCGASPIATSGCTVSEYGDPFVIMGNIRAGHFNAFQKNVLGYIPGGVATHSAGSTTYNIGPIELAAQSLYGVRIPTSKSNRTYWLEFRQAIGFDAAIPGIGALGAQVRVAKPTEFICGGCSASSDDTEIVDMTPGTATFTDAALLAGQTFVDTGVTPNVTIEVLSATSSSVSVRVTTGAAGAPTTTTLASSLNPSNFGQSVTFTATVTGTNPTGTVAFRDGATTISTCTAVALTGSGNTRTAACAVSNLTVGTHSMTAVYGGDAGNAGSTSSALSQTVKAVSTTTVASSLNPSTSGQNVTFTATVTGTAPTGNVGFTSDGGAITGCTAVALTGSGNTRTAACNTTTLTVGTHAIVATYGGNAGNAASTSTSLSQVVNTGTPTPTTTTLASSANPSTAGATVTFTATVTGSAPTGNVAFTANGTGIAGCGAVALVGSGNSRTAACPTAALATGTHAIVATYGGNAGNAASTSTPLSQVVNAAGPGPSSTALASSPNPSTVGGAVTFTATVTGNAPTGNVAFTANGVGIAGCSAIPLVGSGNSRTGACMTAALAAGTHSIVAAYGGDAGNTGSTSTPLSQVVNSAGPGASTTTLASSQNPANAGASVTFTATVTGTAPGGTVAFTSNGSGIGGCSAVALTGSGNSRTAACATAPLTAGTYSIVAAYGGDAGNTGSTSTPLSQVVTATALKPTKTTLTSASNTSTAGPPVALIATIVATPPVAGGTVSFTANGASVAGCVGLPIVAAGTSRTATCNAAFPFGAYSVVASYSGDGSSQPSTSLVFSQVVPAAAIGNTLQFAAQGYSVNENGSGSVVLTVTRSGDVSNGASVSYATASGSATPGVDFTSTFGQLQWPAHDASPRNIVVPIFDDGIAESTESFMVALSLPQGATLGTVSSTTVGILDDESVTATTLPAAIVAQHPYGTLSVQNALLSGNTISGWQNKTVIQLGALAGAQGSFAKIDFPVLNLLPGQTMTIRSGAPGQTIVLANAASIEGVLRVEGANGAPPPLLVLETGGMSIGPGGEVIAPAGLFVDAVDVATHTGGVVVNEGRLDGGPSLAVWAAKVNGGGAFRGNAITFATFGNLNNPVNGAHYLSNGLQLYPANGSDVSVTLAGFGASPQFMNLMIHGNARLSMPSAWPAGSTLPANNRPVMPNETRPPGAPVPTYGGGSMIVQAKGNFTLDGGVSQDFVFPGGLAFLAGGMFNVNGVGIDNGWTQSGTPLQGVFIEAPTIVNSSPASTIVVRTNNFNWVNFSSRPAVPVKTFTLQQQPAGAQFLAADAVSPHFNFYSITTEAAATGQCWTCLMNTQVMDFSVAP